MKKLFSLISIMTLALVLVACGATTTVDTNVTTQAAPMVLNWNIGADPDTLDPALNAATDGGDVINNTFEGLVRDVAGVISPGIAESWDVSEDGLTYTFHLRHSLWSDGSELTANDFVWSWQRAIDPNTASDYSYIWEYTNVENAYDPPPELRPICTTISLEGSPLHQSRNVYAQSKVTNEPAGVDDRSIAGDTIS